MGQEIPCRAHCNGRTARGKALLESNELLFRGDFRLKIPFSAIKEVKCTNGELRVNTAEGLTIFDLGPKSESWRDKILNPKSLIEKLGVKPGDPVTLNGAFDKSFREDLKKHGAKINTGSDGSWIFLAVVQRGDLSTVKHLAKDLRAVAALWVIYPKGQKGITENDVRSAGLKAGLTDVKVASFSSTHTALKFIIPKAKR